MKSSLLIILSSFLFALKINFYTFTLKQNYTEYFNSKVIDKDKNKFFDIKGIGISLKNNLIKYTFEYAKGIAYYEDDTQINPLKIKEKNVYLINTFLSFGNPFSIDIGFRCWNRGKSEYEGDYNEKYYWPYAGISLTYKFYLNKLIFHPLFSYQKAINPKLKIFLGNSPTINLGKTTGYKIEFPLFYKRKNYNFFIFYRYQYWHINRSALHTLTLNKTNFLFFEPESKTKNQYIGIGLSINF